MELGGYFELERNKTKEFHNSAIRLNSARNAFEYLLVVKKYQKVYIPFYTCDSILQPLIKHNIEYEFYKIDLFFNPIFQFEKLKKNEVFFYVNFFGVKNEVVERLANSNHNLIIDNSQAFFDKPFVGIDTFYSARKFFGVPDGAYLYSDKILKEPIRVANSISRMNHLLIRLDKNAREGYESFCRSEDSLNDSPLLLMSNLTRRLLESIDYKDKLKRRIQNFKYLGKHLNSINKIKFNLCNDQAPMYYPLLIDNFNIKDKLIKQNIFVPTFWNEVLNRVDSSTVEYNLTTNLHLLPIDHRYTKMDLNKILEIINYEYCRK